MPHITFPLADLRALSGIADLSLPRLDELAPLVKGELKLRASSEDEVKLELQDTNRPDTWTVEGVARMLRRHAGLAPLDDPARLVAPRAPAGTIEVDPALEPVRPYVAGFLCRGWTVDDAGLRAFIAAQEVLCKNYGRKRKGVAIGIYDGSRLQLPVRYQAVGLDDASRAFVPLAPVDADAARDARGEPIPAARWSQPWTPRQVLTDHPTGREYAAALGPRPEDSAVAPFLVDATGAVLSFPPLINSAGLGRVVPGMDVLFVEATGTVLDQVLLATNILAANLQDRGATIEPVLTRYPYDTPRGREVLCPHPLDDRRSVTLELSEARRLLGEPGLSLDEAERCLTRLGVAVRREGQRLIATTPPWRADYLHPVDALEDVAISRGYQSFAPAMPAELTLGGLAAPTNYGDRLREVLIGCGFEEAIGNILTAEPELRARMALEGSGPGFPPLHGGPLVRIDNVMNENYAVLRDWVIPTLVEVERRSSGATFPHRTFELGEVAVWDPAENHSSRTELRLAALVSHDRAGFSELQAVLHEVLRRAGLELDLHPAGGRPTAGRYALLPCQHPSFIPGRVTRVLAGGEELGVLGELHPEVLTRAGVYFPAAAFELRVEALRACS